MRAFHFSVTWVDNWYTGHMSQLITVYPTDKHLGSFQQRMKTLNNTVKSYFMRTKIKVIFVKEKKLKKILLLSAPDCRCSLSVSHKSNIMKQSLCTHIFFFPFSFFSFLNQLNPHLKIRRTYIKLTFLAFSWKSVSLVVQMVKKKKKKTACNAGGPEFDPWVAKIPWRRKWQLTLVFLSGELYGQRSLAGYSLWSYKELDMTERAHILTALKTNYTPFLHF